MLYSFGHNYFHILSYSARFSSSIKPGMMSATIQAHVGEEARAFPNKNLTVLRAKGLFELDASKRAAKLVASNPHFNANTELLIDLRGLTA